MSTPAAAAPDAAPDDRRRRALFLAVLLATGITWGSSQTFGKIATSTGHGPFGLIVWQMVIGAMVLAPLAGRFRPGAARLRLAALIAVIGTLVPNTTFYLSVARLPAGIMSIVIALVPILSFPIALMLGMDRTGAARLAGLLLGLAGVALIALPGGQALPQPGMAALLPLALVGPLFYAIEANVVARTGTAGMNPVQTLLLVSGVGAVMILPVAVASGQWIDPFAGLGLAEGALVVSSVGHAFAYTAYVWLAARAGATFAAQVSYIVTGSGVVWAMLILGERFPPTVWAALALMLAGVALVRPRAPSRV